MKRLFFALKLDPAVVARLASEARGDAIRWERPENYHVTLRFLGATPEPEIETDPVEVVPSDPCVAADAPLVATAARRIVRPAF